MSAISAVSGASTVITATNAYFNKYDLVKIPSTGEIALVTAVTTTAVTLERCYQSAITSAQSAATLADIVIIGSAFEEGSAESALTTLSSKTSVVTNYLQIFRKSVEITKSMANTELYGGADRPYQRKKKGIELMRDLERTFLFGEPVQDTGSWVSVSHARRTSGGIFNYITTNATNAGGALTESEFEGFLRSVFRYGSNTRYLFCSPLVISVISLWAKHTWASLRAILR
jgi:hypothetical protein